MSAIVLLVDHSKTKLYFITNKSSYKILMGISIEKGIKGNYK